jgi:hypothetical protein
MYANAAYHRLFETALPTPGERSFGIVGVALPAPSLAGWHPPSCPGLGCYTTLEEDLIIRGVNFLLPDTAPDNVAVDTVGSTDDKGHSLIENYLANPTARAQILDHVSAFVGAFEPLEVMLNTSTITAYLSWDSGADLDLHVWERDARAHVYTAFPESEFGGHLDADDQDGYGPEHYYAECAALADGTDFLFAVGYYAGEGPVTAELRLTVGEATRVYKRELAAPTRGQSLTQPVPMVRLRAKKQAPFDPKHQLIDDYEVELVASVGVE